MSRFCTLLLSTVLLTPVAAQDTSVEETLTDIPPLRQYTVEVIVFSYTEDVSVGSEIFLPDPPPEAEYELVVDEDGNPILVDEEIVPVFDEDPEEEAPAWIVVLPKASEEPPVENDSVPLELMLLGEDELMLGDAIRQFELLDAYETIMHFGWTQPTYSEDATPPIELQLLGEPPEGLNGTFTLYLSRYLHLVVDLALDAPVEFEKEVVDDDSFFNFGDSRPQYEEPDTAELQLVRFRIQENRILKNGELRYFDHPKFGILAKVTRVEEREAEPSDEEVETEALARGSGQ